MKSPPTLKARALRLLAQREHSRAELMAKLSRHVQEGEDLSALLDTLAAKGFIDEARVAESLLHRRAPLLGSQRVLQELRSKGLSEELLRASAEQLTGTEVARALAVWRKRFGGGPAPADARERARQMRFLAARGFSGETVRRALARAGEPESGPEPEPGCAP
ncbi:recombination regulator RecX [Comamonas flocculans]|uniref:Regulatory protein RecX n=1 Tax=Comamonas flocculans TaxID=2597701 RepID=A0A5B8RTQ9_9BURK|nr:recombination regulator RecX [Comamonas flocculans]QEA12870.1 recombination regulator RecX [Comamonas flocculans]